MRLYRSAIAACKGVLGRAGAVAWALNTLAGEKNTAHASPAPMGAAVAGGGTAPTNPFTAADLSGGNALLMPTIEANAATLLADNHMTRFARHIATLEQNTTLSVQLLADLGLARNYHLHTTPAMVRSYCQDILFIDAVPGMTDPGRQGLLPDGTTPIQAGALTHSVRSLVNAANAALAAPTTATRAPGGAAGGILSTVSTTRAQPMSQSDMTALMADFSALYHFLPPAHELGNGSAFGHAFHYCVKGETYPLSDEMDYLKLRPDGQSTGSSTQKVQLDAQQNTLTIADVDGVRMETTNATHHVEAFTRKANTIMLVTVKESRRTGQNGAGSSDPTKQLTLADVNFALSIMRENQRQVSKDAMAAAIAHFEREVKALHTQQTLYTLGAAFQQAATATLRPYLMLQQSFAVATGQASSSTSDNSEMAKLKRDLKEKQDQLNKMRRGNWGGRGRRWYGNYQYNNQSGQGNWQNNGQNNAHYYNQPSNSDANTGKGGKGGKGAKGGGRQQGGRGAGATVAGGPGSIGPSGLERKIGGNPQGETCPDWVNGVCHQKRVACDRKHAY